MTREVASAERLFQKARKDFVTLASRTLRTLTRESSRLRRELSRANKRVARLRAQQTRRARKLAKTTTAATRRRLKTQLRKLSKGLDEAVAEASNARALLRPVVEQLNSARVYVGRATGVDKLIKKVERDWQEAGRRARAKRRAEERAAAPARRPRTTATKKKSAARSSRKTSPARRRGTT